MRRPLLLLTSLSTIALTSCGLFDKHVWNWDASTEGYKINYCLLIGQIDHNDSMYRTRGTREGLGTRVDTQFQKDNFNLEGAKQGHIILDEGGTHEQTFEVNELESLEQKSFAGATWDPITANGTTGTWIAKHGKNITCFVSNNDGMAEGAIKAFNWYEGMPIFGYDANMSTLKLINQDKIMGTVDSNTAGQCLVTSVIIRNIYNASLPQEKYNGKSLIQKMWEEDETPYNPIYEGFKYDQQEYAEEAGDQIKEITYGHGYVHSTVTFDGCKNADLTSNPQSHHAILLKNRTVAKEKYISPEDDPSAIKTDFFFDNNGNALTSAQIYDKAEGNGTEDEPITNPITPDPQAEAVRVWQSWYSDTDTFFSGNMDPYFNITQASNMFNLSVTPAKSNGADESKNLDALSAVLSKGKDVGPNAFLINPVQQPNSLQYITRIAEAYKLEAKENWIDRSDIPVIFWNRQPTNLHGAISSEDVMNNKYFKYTYYIGFDAKQGGELQGKMVKAWLNKTYQDSFND